MTGCKYGFDWNHKRAMVVFNDLEELEWVSSGRGTDWGVLSNMRTAVQFGDLSPEVLKSKGLPSALYTQYLYTSVDLEWGKIHHGLLTLTNDATDVSSRGMHD